jgi:hypothetical protein
LNEVFSGPWTLFTSTAIIRSRALDPFSFDAPVAAESPGRILATAIVSIIVKTYDGMNEVDLFIIRGE